MRYSFLALLLAAQYSFASPLIAVDIGHTESVFGAVSAYGVPEYRYNLALASYVGRALQQKGFQVKYVNHADLVSRTELAKDAALFVSIHHDSAKEEFLERKDYGGGAQLTSKKFKGYSLYASLKNPFPDASQLCARAVARQMYMIDFPAKHHAKGVAGENREWLYSDVGVYRYDDLVVLKHAKQPAILVEAGVIVNPKEALRLAKPETEEEIAQAVAKGVVDCFKPATP